MKTLVLDTNFLLIPYQFKLDIFRQIDQMVESSYEFVTCSAVMDELKRISKGYTKRAVAARFALKLLSSKKVKIIESIQKADDWIFSYAKENESIIVCTNDIYLRQMVKKTGKKVIGLRTKSKLSFL